MRLPDFLGIGAQKGGTTYLHGLLKCHPQLFLATPKEQQFFSLHWQRGVAWYSNQFESAALHQCCGEITPYYLFHPESPERIYGLHPTVKLISNEIAVSEMSIFEIDPEFPKLISVLLINSNSPSI